MRHLLCGTMVAFLVCVMSTAWAAQPVVPANKDTKTSTDAAGNQPKREQLREKIHTVKMVRMVDALDLDEEKALTISKILKDYENQQEELGKQRKLQMLELRKMIGQPKPDEMAIQKSVDQLVATDAQISRTHQDEFKAVSIHLTPLQKARYLMFRQEFNRAVGDVLRRARTNPQRVAGDRPPADSKVDAAKR